MITLKNYDTLVYRLHGGRWLADHRRVIKAPTLQAARSVAIVTTPDAHLAKFRVGECIVLKSEAPTTAVQLIGRFFVGAAIGCLGYAALRVGCVILFSRM